MSLGRTLEVCAVWDISAIHVYKHMVHFFIPHSPPYLSIDNVQEKKKRNLGIT